MGMYTEIFFRANIKHDADPAVLELLDKWFNKDEWFEGARSELPAHELFDCPRWELLASNGDSYFPYAYGSHYGKQEFGLGTTLALHCTLKNYHDEISKFFDWIDPYVSAIEGEFLGYELYEDAEPGTSPISYFKK